MNFYLLFHVIQTDKQIISRGFYPNWLIMLGHQDHQDGMRPEKIEKYADVAKIKDKQLALVFFLSFLILIPFNTFR